MQYIILYWGGERFILETNGKKTVKNDVIVLALHHHMDELVSFRTEVNTLINTLVNSRTHTLHLENTKLLVMGGDGDWICRI